MPNCSFSLETLYCILNLLKEPSTNFSSVGKQFGISYQECINLFDKYVSVPTNNELPIIMCFDEKFLNRTIAVNGYSFIIVDFLNRKLIDMISTRHKDDLYKYFSKFPPEKRKKVKYIIIDMYPTYLEIAEIFFPDAIVIVDSFHVVRNVRNSFDTIRKNIQKIYDNGANEIDQNTEYYYILKSCKDSLLKFYPTLKNEREYNRRMKMYISERTFVNYALKIDPLLEKSYYLLQDYYEFNKYASIETAEELLEEIIDNYKLSKITEFEDLSYTFTRWKKYIINSFITIRDEKFKKQRRLSNGPIESINNFIERIHVIGNGFKNFPLFKKICLCKINKTLIFNF